MLGPVAFQVLVGIEEAKVVAKSIVFGVVRRVVEEFCVSCNWEANCAPGTRDLVKCRMQTAAKRMTTSYFLHPCE
jgi:hypothetical protein